MKLIVERLKDLGTGFLCIGVAATVIGAVLALAKVLELFPYTVGTIMVIMLAMAIGRFMRV